MTKKERTDFAKIKVKTLNQAHQIREFKKGVVRYESLVNHLEVEKTDKDSKINELNLQNSKITRDAYKFEQQKDTLKFKNDSLEFEIETLKQKNKEKDIDISLQTNATIIALTNAFNNKK